MKIRKVRKELNYWVACSGCSQRYDLREFDDESPPEACGECGCYLFSTLLLPPGSPRYTNSPSKLKEIVEKSISKYEFLGV